MSSEESEITLSDEEFTDEIEATFPLRGMSYNSAIAIAQGGWLYKKPICKKYQEVIKDLIKDFKKIDAKEIEASYLFSFKGNKKLDVANFEKLLTDSFNKVLFEDDSLIYKMHLEKRMNCTKDTIKITLKKIK